MFLLKKVFQLRDKANPDMEKPFLEHLEDLRVMITRVVLTLVISMVACFTFQEQLMAILRKPVEDVRRIHTTKSLPDEIDLDAWESAKSVEHAASTLEGPAKDAYLARQSEATRELIGDIRLLRAALTLPESERPAYLEEAAGPGRAARIAELIELKASAEIDLRGNLSLMSALRPTETFMLSMKLSFFAGIVVAFPLLLMFTLQFVLPGLHQHEKKVMWPALAVGFGLFLSGVLFAYYFVLPRALTFFYEWGGNLGVSNDWRIGEYITFATQFTLLFGLSFELPVVVMVLVKLGLIGYDTMSRTRSYAILAIFVVAAIITPTPDAFTLCLMATPMVLLYELCIWLAWFDERKARRAEEAEERARMERLLTDTGDTEDGEEEDRDDPWHDGERPWESGGDSSRPPDDSREDGDQTEAEDDTPPESIPDEEKRRMSDPGTP